MKKRQVGNAMLSSVASIFMIVIVFLVILYAIRLRITNEAIVRVEDGLAISCLAALKVDMEQYMENYTEESVQLYISDYEVAYETFCESLEVNLGLKDDFFNPYQNVVVDTFVVYNVVEKEYVEVYEFNRSGTIRFNVEDYGEQYAPNGVLVDETSIYAKVEFQLEGWNGTTITGSKQLLTGVKMK